MLRIRTATVEDVPALMRMIVEFATFEKLADRLSVTEASMLRDGFGPSPQFHTLLPEWNGQLAGYVIYFPFYSSFQGTCLFLEDIYVRQEFRGKGIGKLLMQEVAAIAVREGYWGVRWEVLDWNQSAIDFYKKLNAEFLEDVKEVLLEKDALWKLAEGAGPR
jgi:GNAT superfamily N-acetyltransferase